MRSTIKTFNIQFDSKFVILFPPSTDYSLKLKSFL